MSEKQRLLDHDQIAQSFGQHAKEYDTVADLQRHTTHEIMQRLAIFSKQPEVILDLGAGTGYGSQQLAKQYPKAMIITLDVAEGMASQAKRQGVAHSVCADAIQLPIATGSIDFVFSNLMFHWVDELPQLFTELKRILKPKGLLMFSMMGLDTLCELQASWREVDAFDHINPFADMHDIGDALYQAKLEDPVMDRESHVRYYSSVGGLARELKTLGAHHLSTTRNPGLTGKSRWQAMEKAYHQFKTEQGFPATYDVIYGHAWGGESLLQQRDRSGEVNIAIEQLRRQLRG